MSGFDDGGMAPPPPPPPSAGGGGAIPARSFGEVFSTAFELYKTNFVALIKVVALIVVPLALIQTLLINVVFAPTKETVVLFGQTITTETRSTGASWAVLLIGILFAVLVYYFLIAVVMRAGALAAIGDAPEVDASMQYGLHRFGSVWWIAILVALVDVAVILVGVLLAFASAGLGVFVVIVGLVWYVYASTMLSMSIPSLVVEDKRGTDALSRSWALVKGKFWHALGIIIVAGILAGIVNNIFDALGGSAWVLGWIFSAIGQIITAPFVALVTIVLYLDLRARQESLTGDVLRSELRHDA